MGTTIAIGGGSIGYERPAQTTKIDKEIVARANKKQPRMLFIPTASNDAQTYIDVFNKHFSKLGCKIETLLLIREQPTKKVIREKIAKADIIYVGGGNTLKMMMLWRKKGVDKELIKAHKKGTIVSGLSAGAICWFQYGNSDSRKYTSKSDNLIRVSSLGIINALMCPHFDTEKNRKQSLRTMMRNTHKIVGLALEENCALEIKDDTYKVLTSKKQAKAYKCFWKNNKYYKQIIPQTTQYQPLNELLDKKL